MGNDLQQTRYDQLIRRVGGIIGPGSKVSEALPELFPMIDVENPPAELLLLGGSRLCMGTIALTANAATFGTAMLRVNEGSDAVIRLIEVVAHPGTTQTIAMGPTQNSSVDAGVEAFADGRVFGQGTVAKVQGVNTNLSVGSTFYRIPAGSSLGVRIERTRGLAIVTPGNAFSVSNTVANDALDVSFMWIERVALESELLFP